MARHSVSLLARWGHFVAGHSRLVLGVSLLVVALGFTGAPIFTAHLLGLGYQTPGTESARATAFIEERTGVTERACLVVWATGRPADPATLAAALNTATGTARQQSVVVDVLPPGDIRGTGAISADGNVITATVLFKGDVGQRQKASASLNKQLTNGLPEGINAAITGNSPLMGDLTEVEGHDMMTAEMVGLPLAFLVLLLALRSLLAAVIPLVLGMCAVGVTLGLLSLTVSLMDWNVFVESFVAMMGLAIGIDYSLLIVRRYREELSAGAIPAQAIARTLETAGRTALFSGMIVAISLVAMAVTGLPFYADSAIGVILVVLVLVTGALTLLPALLIVLGDRLDLGKFDRLPKLLADNGNRWERWARTVMNRPVPVLLVGALILLAAAVPVLFVKTGTDLNARAMRGESAADALAVVQRAFPAASLTPMEVLLRSPEHSMADTTQAALKVLSGHGDLGPASQMPLRPDATLLVVTPTVAADSMEADALVRDVRTHLTHALPPGATAEVTGVTAELVDYKAETNRWTPFVVLFTLGLSFLVLLWVFRSPLLAAKAIVLNLLTVAAALGLTILTFQEGLGEDILGFTSLGFVQGWMPITLFLVMFGLAMDYEVFIVSRIREEYERTANTVDAVAAGLGRTGIVVTSAAAIMVAIFGSFCLNRIPEMKQMGFGLAVAVLLDATLVRAALVPAFMKVVGKWNWWMPRRLDRLLPELRHR